MDFNQLDNVLAKIKEQTSLVNNKEKRAILELLSKKYPLPGEKSSLEKQIQEKFLALQQHEKDSQLTSEIDNFNEIKSYTEEKASKSEELLKLFDNYSKLSTKLESIEDIIMKKNKNISTIAKEILNLATPLQIDTTTLPFPLTQNTLEALGCNLADFPFQLASFEGEDEFINKSPIKINLSIEKKEKVILSIEKRKKIHEFLQQKINIWTYKLDKYCLGTTKRFSNCIGFGSARNYWSKEEFNNGLTGYQLLLHNYGKGTIVNDNIFEFKKIRNFGVRTFTALETFLIDQGIPLDYNLSDLRPEEWGEKSYEGLL